MRVDIYGRPPSSRDELLAAPIAKLVEYWVGVQCTDRCNRTPYIPLRLMAAKRGGPTRRTKKVEPLFVSCPLPEDPRALA